jgi:tetratricopeptide (TPR) repeat protein
LTGWPRAATLRPVSRRPANFTPPPKSSAPGAPAAAGGIDLALESEIFWDRHKSKIIGAVVLLLLSIVAYSVFLFVSARAIEAANTQFSAAKTIEELKKMVADHPTSVVSADAYLVLAQKQAEAKDFEGAAASAQTVIEKFPNYPLLGAARLALGANLAAAGKLDEAEAAYKIASDSNPKDFAAPLALLARANLAKLRGNSTQARRFLDDVIARYPNTDSAMQAEQEKRFVRGTGGAAPSTSAEKSAAPAPVASPAAAPAPK